MPAVFIYALCAPDTGEIRYVGASRDPRKRLKEHLWTESSRPEDAVRAPKDRWLQRLRRKGMRPALCVLEELDEAHAAQTEKALIVEMRDAGVRLLNLHHNVAHTAPHRAAQYGWRSKSTGTA